MTSWRFLPLVALSPRRVKNISRLSMKTLDSIAKLEYDKLEIECLTQVGKGEWHGETKCGLYIAVSNKGKVITISSSETLYELGEYQQIVAKSKDKINIHEIIKYFSWQINKDDILNNWH
tara:strand:+ start:64 stop:423 length:360 start_codon:yes stop_codon:yes gene_type:complete